jgi:multiple sugar transport system ATP-binding protein
MTMGDRVAVMRDGRLEQADSPQALYDRPANLFVAAFIGSPAMNLVPGRLVGEATLVLAGRHALALPRALAASLRGRSDVIVGIRPEALDRTRRENGAAEPLELPVALTEALGSDTLVHLELDGPRVGDGGGGVATALAERTTTLITARLPPHTRAVPGERLRVEVDVGRLHFFDPVSERALP